MKNYLYEIRNDEMAEYYVAASVRDAIEQSDGMFPGTAKIRNIRRGSKEFSAYLENGSDAYLLK
jgi:hypothetical protein